MSSRREANGSAESNPMWTRELFIHQGRPQDSAEPEPSRAPHQEPIIGGKDARWLQPRWFSRWLMLTNAISLLAAGELARSAQAVHQATGGANLERHAASWTSAEDSWNFWWSYAGVSGPNYWGLLNPDWSLCDKGRRQSPINIETRALVYDPHLRPLRLDDNNLLLSGILYNDGHSIVFNISASPLAASRHEAASLATPSAAAVATEPQPQGLHLGRPELDNVSGRSVRLEARPKRDSFELPLAIEQPAGASRRALARARPLMLASDQMTTTSRLGEQLADSHVSANQVGVARDDTIIRAAASNEHHRPDDQAGGPASEEDEQEAGQVPAPVFLSGAGLAYTYKLELFRLRFGQQTSLARGTARGSEHQIDSRSFAAELQIFAYNGDLYTSFHEAATKPHGLAAIAILIDLLPGASSLSKTTQQHYPPAHNEQFESLLTQASQRAAFRGQHLSISKQLNLTALFAPGTMEQFVTYEGSLTQPGCHETVTWILLNRPLYVTQHSLDRLQSISTDEQAAMSSSGALLAGNIRPIQPTNDRPLRTNIRPPSNGLHGKEAISSCPRLWTRYEYLRNNLS